MSLKKLSWLFLLILVFLSIRVTWLFLMPMDLYGDEAQYWFWAQNLDLGYYSKPPMVAWGIKATTIFCGNDEACIRLSSPILHALTAIAIYLIGRQLFSYLVGFFSALIYLTLPAVSLSSNLITTDPFLLCFWSLAMLALQNALTKDKWLAWILTGIFCGFGMMSKYSMIIFLLCLLLYLLIEKKLHIYLRHRKFWVAALIALIIWLPNLWWNYSHSMASFGHVVDQVKGPEVKYLNFPAFLQFFIAQFAIFGPLLLSYLFIKILSDKSIFKLQSVRFLLCFSAPILIIALQVALFSRAHANWAVPCYIGFSILAAYLCLEKYKMKKFLYANVILHITIAVIVMIYALALGNISLLPLNKQTDIFKRIRGNEIIGKQLAIVCNHYPNLKVVSDNRMNISLFQYYTHKSCPKFIKWNPSKIIHDHFDLTTDLNNYIGQDLIFITDYYNTENLKMYANEVEQENDLHYTPYEGFSKSHHVFILRGFKGY